MILDSMEFIPQQFQSGSCTASQWTEDTSFCRTNPTQCAQDREECYRLIDSNGTAVNHHCNAAMAFTIITGKVLKCSNQSWLMFKSIESYS